MQYFKTFLNLSFETVNVAVTRVGPWCNRFCQLSQRFEFYFIDPAVPKQKTGSEWSQQTSLNSELLSIADSKP